MSIKGRGMGGSSEEEYFYRLNKELIERKRKEQEEQKALRAPTEARGHHWMKCPKCSSDMVEVALAGIKIDQCNVCRGIYFDHGELDILIDSKEPKGFIGAMKGLFR
ncbi:MAG: zf-TFIIB domain-containing protein [Oligoflexales bacterium]|nr:zf-TFIIB domain-containing protein [Oligoflexales bacterium]